MQATVKSRVFISYSRADLSFTNELAAALELSGDFEILIDLAGIEHGEAWRERLGKLIAACDSMVFVLSPDSVASEVCAWEIGEASRLSKRIIPVLWRAVDFAMVPEDLSAIHAVPFDGEHAVSGLPRLIQALHSDLAWLREHTRLAERAAEWEQSGRATAYLLRSAALAAAREWLAAQPDDAPGPTNLQRDFIQASEEEESRLLSDERRRLKELEKAKAVAEAERDAAQTARANEALAARRVFRATTTGLIASLILLGVASAAGWLAYRKAQDEQAAAAQAALAATEAQRNAARAESAEDLAIRQRDEARLIQSRFLARAAQGYLTRGDTANAIGLARAALPTDRTDPDRPFAIKAAQVLFDAYGRLLELATLRGHTAGVKGALALPGQRLLSWARDGTMRWWDGDGTLLKTVLAHDHPTQPDTSEDTGVHGVLPLDDGRLLSWGVDKTAKLWKIDGTLIRTFLSEAHWIRLERLADGRIAARIGNEYRVWSAALEPLLVLRSPLKWLRGTIQLADGRFVTWQQGTLPETGKQAHTAMLWHADGRPQAVLEGHTRGLLGAIELADGRIVTFENGPGVRIWSSTGQLEQVIERAHDHMPFWPFAFPLSDGRFYTWGQEAYHDNVWWGRLWDAQGQSQALIAASDAPLRGLELDDNRLLLGTNSPTPTIWHSDGTRGPALVGHQAPAYAAAQWPDGRIATHSADHTARLWSRDGVPLLQLSGHEDGVSGITPLADARMLTWSFGDRTARIWSEQPMPRNVLRIEGGDARMVEALAGGALAVLTNSGSIALFDANLRPGPVLRNDAREVTELVELADGRLVTRGRNHSNREPGPALRLWTGDGEPIADLAGPDDEVLHLAITPSGGLLGFGASGEVWLWRVDGKLQRKSQTGSGTADYRLYRVDPLHDGRFVTWDSDRRLQLWSAAGEPGAVISTDQTPPPKRIAALGDRQILLIDQTGGARVWSDVDKDWQALDLGTPGPNDAAIPLRGGKVLLVQSRGSLIVVNPDRSLREFEYLPGRDGAYRRHRVVRLADGRLLVSTTGRGTHVWSAYGVPGPRILDTEIGGARLLSSGSVLVWPNAGGDDDLQIVSIENGPGPLLRGHQSAIKEALQLADGRIVSWAEDSTVRLWPGSVDQAIAWADEVVARLKPLTLDERCDHYLETPAACAESDRR